MSAEEQKPVEVEAAAEAEPAQAEEAAADQQMADAPEKAAGQKRKAEDEPEPAAPAEPVQLGFRTFNGVDEARTYFQHVIKSYKANQNLNEVRRRGPPSPPPCCLSARRPRRAQTAERPPAAAPAQYELVAALDLLQKGHPRAAEKVRSSRQAAGAWGRPCCAGSCRPGQCRCAAEPWTRPPAAPCSAPAGRSRR
jgi:hypothetical protein